MRRRCAAGAKPHSPRRFISLMTLSRRAIIYATYFQTGDANDYSDDNRKPHISLTIKARKKYFRRLCRPRLPPMAMGAGRWLGSRCRRPSTSQACRRPHRHSGWSTRRRMTSPRAADMPAPPPPIGRGRAALYAGTAPRAGISEKFLGQLSSFTTRHAAERRFRPIGASRLCYFRNYHSRRRSAMRFSRQYRRR